MAIVEGKVCRTGNTALAEPDFSMWAALPCWCRDQPARSRHAMRINRAIFSASGVGWLSRDFGLAASVEFMVPAPCGSTARCMRQKGVACDP